MRALHSFHVACAHKLPEGWKAKVEGILIYDRQSAPWCSVSEAYCKGFLLGLGWLKLHCGFNPSLPSASNGALSLVELTFTNTNYEYLSKRVPNPEPLMFEVRLRN